MTCVFTHPDDDDAVVGISEQQDGDEEVDEDEGDV